MGPLKEKNAYAIIRVLLMIISLMGYDKFYKSFISAKK